MPPQTMADRKAIMIAADFSLVINIPFKSESASAAALTETAPAVAAAPAQDQPAAWSVVDTRAAGTPAAGAFWANSADSTPADTGSPCFSSLLARRARA